MNGITLPGAGSIGEKRAGNKILLKVPVMTRKLRMALMGIYVIPLVVIAYLYVQYIYPMFTAWGQEVLALGISAVLTFAIVISLLGLALISRTATDSVCALNDLNGRMDELLCSTKRFEETGYVDTLIDSIAKSSKELLNAEASSLLLYDDNMDLRFEYVEGAASAFLKGKAVKLGEGITGWAAQEKRPVIVNDVQGDPRFAKRFDKDSGFITKAILCVPLVFSGRDLGVLEVINKRVGDGNFTEEDKDTLVSLAEHAAAAIYRNRSFEEMKSDFVQVMEILVMAMDNYMPEKKGHARRVARYSVKLAKDLGLSEQEVRQVYFGSLLHDIGLLKFDLVEYQEKGKYRLHPSAGADMIKNITQWKEVAHIVRDHHERYDGAGYPAGLSGQDISLGGRIVCMAEAFDVMTSKNSYKPSISFDEAAEEIRALAGYQFDPNLSEVFLAAFRKDDLAEAA